jgi:hypothetical protein
VSVAEAGVLASTVMAGLLDAEHELDDLGDRQVLGR